MSDFAVVFNDIDRIDFGPRPGLMVEITDIAVMTERGKGIGRSLVDGMLLIVQGRWPDTQLVYAWTRESNTNAHAFYGALGFCLLGRLSKVYEQREDALVYGLRLCELARSATPRSKD